MPQAAEHTPMGPQPQAPGDSISLDAMVMAAERCDMALQLLQQREQARAQAQAEAAIPPWTRGLSGEARPISVGENSGVLCIVAAISLLMMLCFRRFSHLLKTLWQELLGMRRRANVFDERTSGESTAIALMAVQWSMCAGLLLYSALAMGGASAIERITGSHAPAIAADPANAFGCAASLIGLSAAFYAAQAAMYATIGYVFTTPTRRRLWLQGFTASQSLLGFALLVPALVSIFYPGAAPAMAAIGAGLYLVARVTFIIKGFRIFYTNFASLLYFILYLCSVEIIPTMIIIKAAQKLIT